VEPTLTWIDLTSRDRDKMRRILDLFSEQGTIDELGLGSLRDALSDALFPGTSSIQTRLRYMLYVPWIYQALERERVGSNDVAGAARRAELALIGPLGASADPEGVIGARARNTLSRLPSSVYWAALVRWGVFLPAQSTSWYHTRFTSLLKGRDDVGRADDPGVVWARQPTWHPRLPPPPEGFPDQVDFRLTRAEADFLRGRIEERCPRSLLAWLVREGTDAPAESFWDDPDALRAGPEIRATVELARRFSLHVEGAWLLYNLLLAERRDGANGKDAELVERYRGELSAWLVREQAERPFDPTTLWSFLARRGARLVELQRRFVETWSTRIAAIGEGPVGEDDLLRRLVEDREVQLKGRGRARLTNQGRLLDWSGRVGVGRMDFRWFRVRQLLIDLHRGLGVSNALS